MANIINQYGQVKLGVRIPPLVSPLWNSIFGVWNGEGVNNLTVKNAWNANGDAVDSKSGANGTIATPSGNSWTPSTMTYGSGKIGSGAFTFNGSNFVALPDNTLNFTGDFSVSCWVYLPNTTGYKPLISCADNSQGATLIKGWRIDSNDGFIRFYTFRPSSAWYGIKVPMTTSNQWVHITLTKVVGQEANIYINGVLGTKTSSSQNGMTSSEILQYASKAHIGVDYYLGSSPTSYNTQLPTGTKIDAIQTWDGTALDQAAVTELYNSGNGQEYPFTLSNALISTTNDAVGSNHGTRPASTLTGGVPGPSFTTGKIGKAFTFDGINDFIQLPNNSLNLAGPFSYSFWIKATDTTGYTVIVGNTQSSRAPYGFSHGYQFWLQYNKIHVTFRDGTDSTNYFLDSVANVATGSWNHVVITYKYTVSNANGIKIYINGSLDSSRSAPNSTNLYSLPMKPAIGARNPSGVYEYFLANGTSLDAMSVWNKELSASEVTELYNSGNGKQYPN